jgi:hypothetical protein
MMMDQNLLANSLNIDSRTAVYSPGLSFSVIAALLIDQAPPYSISSWKWSQRFIRPQYSDAEFAAESRLNIVPRVIPDYPSYCGSAPAPEAECIGNNSWVVLPYTGISSSSEGIRLSTVIISVGQVVTLGSTGNISVAGNFSIGCNSTLISQGSQITVNGGSTICGTLQISKLDPSKTTLTTAACVNFTNADFLLNVSSLAPSLTGEVTINVAQFGCNAGPSLGTVGLQVSPDDCRSYRLSENQPSNARSLSVVIAITQCPGGLVPVFDVSAQFPIAPVVGGVVGGVVLIALIVAGSIWWSRRSKFDRDTRNVQTRLRTMSRNSTS